MIIRVKFEKDFDSEEFYSGFEPEELSEITFEQFKEAIIYELYDYTNEVVDLATFEIVE